MLKQLIQRLLDSRTTPAQAANASKPVSGIPVEYSPSPSIGTWGQVLPDSIAVSDGYIWAAGRTSAIGGFLQVSSQAMQTTTSGTSIGEGEMLNIFIPVSKGQGFTVYARSMNQIVVRLVRTIGGGYNRIVRRAVLCLKPSFSFSPRSSCKANLSGSAVRHTLQGGLRSRPASPNMSLQRTATWGSTNLIRARITASMFTHSGQTVTSSQEKLLDSLLVPRTSLSQVLFPLRKAIALLSAVPSQSFGSHQQWGVNTNLQTGGALC